MSSCISVFHKCCIIIQNHRIELWFNSFFLNSKNQTGQRRQWKACEESGKSVLCAINPRVTNGARWSKSFDTEFSGTFLRCIASYSFQDTAPFHRSEKIFLPFLLAIRDGLSICLKNLFVLKCGVLRIQADDFHYLYQYLIMIVPEVDDLVKERILSFTASIL